MKYILIVLLSSNMMVAYDLMHFFSATPSYGALDSNRFPLSTLQTMFGYGSTKESWNNIHKKTALFDLYGTHRLSALGMNKTLNDNVYDHTLRDLASEDLLRGNISIGARFLLEQYFLKITHHVDEGFFCSLHLPLRYAQLNQLHINDLSDTSSRNWKFIADDITGFLAHYDINLSNYRTYSWGDISCIAGWSYSDYDTYYLDYIDYQLTVGLLLPTSNISRVSHPLYLSLGYNGHYGIPCSFGVGVGYLDWLSLDIQANTLLLTKKKEWLRLRTSPYQTGMLFIYAQEVNVRPGVLINISSELKADHLFRGISFAASYNYTAQHSTHLELKDSALKLLAKSDERFKGWSMHIVSLGLEYDYNTHAHQSYPIINVEYRWILRAQRTFNTPVLQTVLSINTTWCF